MEFHSHFSSSPYLINRVRNRLITNVSLICSIVKDYRIIVYCIVNPFTKFFFSKNCSCWIIWITQIYHVNTMIWNLRYEVIVSSARNICNVTPLIVFKNSSTSNHHVRIYVDRINRICNSDIVVPAQDFLEISSITLGSIVYKNLVHIKMYSPREKIILDNCLTQEIISSFWTITSETG